MKSENNNVKNKVKHDVLESPVHYDDKLNSYQEARARIFAEPQPFMIHLNGDQLTQEEDDYDSAEEPAYSGSEDVGGGHSSDREDEMRMRRRDRRGHRDEGEEHYGEESFGGEANYGSESYDESEDEEFDSSELGDELVEPSIASEPGNPKRRPPHFGGKGGRRGNTNPSYLLDNKYHGQLFDPSSYSRDIATLLSPDTSSSPSLTSITSPTSVSSSRSAVHNNFVSQPLDSTLHSPHSSHSPHAHSHTPISASANPFVPTKAPLLSDRGQPYPSANGSSTPGGYIPTAEEYATLLQKYHSLASLHDNCKNVNNLLISQRDDLRRQLVETVATLQDKKVLIPEINTRLHSLLQLIHALGLAHPQFQHLLEPIASSVNKLCQLSSPHGLPLPAPAKSGRHSKQQTEKKKAQEPAKETKPETPMHAPSQIQSHTQSQGANTQTQSPAQDQGNTQQTQPTHKNRQHAKSNSKRNSAAHQARIQQAQAQAQALLQSQYQAQIQAQIIQAQLIQAAQMQAHNFSSHLPLQPPPSSSRGKSNKNGSKRTNSSNRQPKSSQPPLQMQQPLVHHMPAQFFQPQVQPVPLPLPLPAPHPAQISQQQSQKRPPQKSKKLYDPNNPQPQVNSPISPQQTLNSQRKAQSLQSQPQSPPQTHSQPQSQLQSQPQQPQQQQQQAQPQLSRIPRSYQQQHLLQQQLNYQHI